MYTFSNTGIDNFLHDYFHHAWEMSGNEHIARGVCHALCWYVSTDRASIDFVKAMLQSNPKHIAKLSLQGGSDEEIIRRITRYIKRKAGK